jgi:hypothetical protein
LYADVYFSLRVRVTHTSNVKISILKRVSRLCLPGSKKRRISMISAHIFHCGASPINGREQSYMLSSLSLSLAHSLCSAAVKSVERSSLRTHALLHPRRELAHACFAHITGAGVTPARENAFLRCRFLFLSLLAHRAKSLSKFLFFTMRCRLSFFLIWICM